MHNPLLGNKVVSRMRVRHLFAWMHACIIRDTGQLLRGSDDQGLYSGLEKVSRLNLPSLWQYDRIGHTIESETECMKRKRRGAGAAA